MGDRLDWAEEHPWIAGLYFGLYLSAILTIFELLSRRPTSVRLPIMLGLATWLLSWVGFALLVKRRFGQRSDAKRYPQPTMGQPWSRTSDRALLWMFSFGAINAATATAELIASLILRPKAAIGGIVWVAASAWWLTTTWAERRKRRAAPGLRVP